ncbi:MAG: hypothetical protein DSY66_00220 [Persephonella sp.]|nr:MAG: hypothetical protein DSY53_04565 [Persephonella sp.]RUM62324.1 MAG: hypothetical protein DSY66_00220 [Persephonella sp.]
MYEYLKKVASGKKTLKDLTYREAYEVNNKILNSEATNIQIGAFWSALRIKYATLDELKGFIDSIKEYTDFIDLSEYKPVDLAVNYDGKNKSIHILPASIFIATGAGAKVVGHGAKNVPSKYGVTYYEVLEAMGCGYPTNSEEIYKAIELSGFTFAYQKIFNRKLYNLLPKRQEFGLRTYINTVEKILNPFKTTKVIIGVNHLNYVEKYIKLAFYTGYNDIYVVKGLEGGIEPSPEKPTKIFTSKVFSLTIYPKELKEKINCDSSITINKNAEICLSILKNEDNPYRDWAILTAGLIIYAYGLTNDISEANKLAEESLKSGLAYQNFKIYKSLTKKRYKKKYSQN